MSAQNESFRDALYEVVGSWPAFWLGVVVGIGGCVGAWAIFYVAVRSVSRG